MPVNITTLHSQPGKMMEAIEFLEFIGLYHDNGLDRTDTAVFTLKRGDRSAQIHLVELKEHTTPSQEITNTFAVENPGRCAAKFRRLSSGTAVETSTGLWELRGHDVFVEPMALRT